MTDNLTPEQKEARRKRQKRASKTKFVCPSCGLRAWAKETASLGCWACGVEMIDSE